MPSIFFCFFFFKFQQCLIFFFFKPYLLFVFFSCNFMSLVIPSASWRKTRVCDRITFLFLWGITTMAFFLLADTFFTFPADTDVFKTSFERLKKVTTSYDQIRRRHDIWKKTSDLRRLEDAWFTSYWRRLNYGVFRTSGLRRPQYVWFTTSCISLIKDVLKTSSFCHLEDVQFMTCWRRPIYDVLKTSDSWRFEDICKMTSVQQRCSDILNKKF